MLLLCLGGIGALFGKLPAASLPQGTGRALCVREGAEGTSIERMKRKHAAGGGRRPAAARPGRGAGGEFQHPAFGRGGDQTGMAIIQLSDWAVREETAASSAAPWAGCSLADIPDVMIRTFQPGFRGGSTAAVQFVLQGSGYGELYQQGLILQQAARQSRLMQSPDLTCRRPRSCR